MPEKLLLVIGYTWPEPNATAAGNRMLQLINFFLEEDYKIVFSSTASETQLSMDLKTLGVDKIPIRLNDSGFDEFVKDLNPEIVLFDRFLTEEQFGWRVAEFAPAAIRVLDTEDLHSLRHTRQLLFKKKQSFTEAAWLQQDSTKREIASIYRCDLSLIISSYEMQLLLETLRIDKRILHHLPFMLDRLNKDTLKNWPSYDSRKDFICIGNGKHEPNLDAIRWLREEIFPKIRKQLPDTNLYVYGAYLPKDIERMDDPKAGFRVMGWAKNAETVMRKARVNLAPLRFGAGIKGKLIDAMQSGTPSVTTTIGAESMHEGYEWSGYIADTAEAFAMASIRLYEDAGEWHNAQHNGTIIINSLYNKNTLGKKLLDELKSVRHGLAAHRNQNFIGALLFHQSLASTKYMAKWIEMKNSKQRL